LSVGNNQSSPDEIPEALRDVTPVPETKRSRLWLLLGSGLGLSLVVAIAGVYVWDQNSEPSVASAPQTEESVSESPEKESAIAKENSSLPKQPSSLDKTPANSETNKDLLGHLPYKEAPSDSLQKVTADGRIKLRTPAAKKFIEMQAAARRDGISLVPLSGFRSMEEQEYLFFGIKAQRGQVTTERAEVSAPPGYSEHHTGYAIDIGDGNAPATHVKKSFAQTEAFRWLKENAARYSFELSFPKDHEKISYEPWHWRYVGNKQSLETFYKDK
jgi:D-alanyl-D-alanine carboxypeptidase